MKLLMSFRLAALLGVLSAILPLCPMGNNNSVLQPVTYQVIGITLVEGGVTRVEFAPGVDKKGFPTGGSHLVIPFEHGKAVSNASGSFSSVSHTDPSTLSFSQKKAINCALVVSEQTKGFEIK